MDWGGCETHGHACGCAREGARVCVPCVQRRGGWLRGAARVGVWQQQWCGAS